MSILSNYKLDKEKNLVRWKGDWTTHKGNPSLLRSDTMLKAIGKLISIRIINPSTRTIPLVVFGNSAITKHYEKKVDSLKKLGVGQSFLSLNPSLLLKKGVIEHSTGKGFQTIKDKKDLKDFLKHLIYSDKIYFSAMSEKRTLGQAITESNKENTLEGKAEKFLKLLEGIL